MKRLHVSFNVSDLDKSVEFYNSLFGQEPSVKRQDYAQWMLDDPRVNFVIEGSTESSGLTHAGIQVEGPLELEETFERIKSAEAPYLPEGVTTCCYHKSEKSWTADPDGVMWEAFLTHHVTEERGQTNLTAQQIDEAKATLNSASTPVAPCCASC